MSDFMLKDGVYPTMVTPFGEDNSIDYAALEKMVAWYIEKGVAGLFAVCQSSEMFFLSHAERVKLSKAVVDMAAAIDKGVQVIASGHISDDISDQIYELKAVAQTGPKAAVIITNRLARADQSDDVWKANAEKILKAVPDVVFGLYECPAPYKRLMSPQLLKWCADTGRFAFVKDTCCSVPQLKEKIEALAGSSLKLYNANSATLLHTLKMGAAGFSGIMANLHPQLYVWLCDNWAKEPELAQELQDFLGVSSVSPGAYPVDAKYYMQLEGLPVSLVTRTRPKEDMGEMERLNMEQLQRQTELWNERLFR
jgi:4-hydroxy-tetrahydrodipicolinate synthase